MALVVINVCYFCKTICGQDMIKIAQPGHGGAVPTPPQAGYWPACTYTCLTGNFRPSAEKASLGDGKRLVKLGQLMNQ